MKYSFYWGLVFPLSKYLLEFRRAKVATATEGGVNRNLLEHLEGILEIIREILEDGKRGNQHFKYIVK